MYDLITQEQLYQFGNLELLAKQVVEGYITGLHKSPFHGFSVEFAEHRIYNTGESTKNIDWKLFARTDKLFVKRFEEETNLRCQIIIDHSGSMYFPMAQKGQKQYNKITFAVQSAAVLMYLLRLQRDAVGLSLFSEKLNVHTHARSAIIHHKMLYYELEQLLKNNKPPENCITKAAYNIHHIAEHIHKRALVILFSDMFDNIDDWQELFSSLRHLKHNKHDVILFHVMDGNKEKEFNYENKPHRFIDMETGTELKLNPIEIRERYREFVSKYATELKTKCTQYKIDYVEADINKGFIPILQSAIIKRSKMF